MKITSTVSSAKAPVFLLPTPDWLFPVSPFPRFLVFLTSVHCSLSTVFHPPPHALL
jgi:hypothetical protein